MKANKDISKNVTNRLLKYAILSEVVGVPVGVKDFQRHCAVDTSLEELYSSFSLLKESEVLEDNEEEIILVRRKGENHSDPRFPFFAGIILHLMFWVKGAILLKSESSSGFTVLFQTNKTGTDLLDRLAERVAKSMLSYMGVRSIIMQKNLKVYQEEILAAFLLSHSIELKGQGFKSQLEDENPWIRKKIQQYLNEAIEEELIVDHPVRKFRKIDTSFYQYLVEFKDSIDFATELSQQVQHARQWLVPRFRAKLATHGII